jgi:hypothetical protein
MVLNTLNRVSSWQTTAVQVSYEISHFWIAQGMNYTEPSTSHILLPSVEIQTERD